MKKNKTGIQIIQLSGMKFWNQLISLLVTMFVSRVFSLSEYGIYTKILLILDFGFAFIVLNLPSCATFFISKYSDSCKKNNFIFTYYVMCSLIGIIMGVLLYVLSPVLCKLTNSSAIMDYRWYLCISPLFQIISKASTYILTAEGESGRAVKISLISSFLTIVSILCTFFSKDKFRMFLFFLLFIDFIQGVYGYYIGLEKIGFFKGFIKEKVRFNFSFVPEMYHYIIPVGISSIIMIINTRIDKLFVFLTSSDTYYAIYSNASKELPVAAFSVVVSSLIIPKFIKYLLKEDKKSIVELWNNVHVFVSIFSFLLLFGTQFFASEVMQLLYSSKYLDGINIFRIYLLLIPFHCISFNMLLCALNQTKYIFRTSIFSLFLNICLDFLLYFFIGYEGLGLATVISTIYMTCMQLYYSAKLLEIKMRSLIPFSKLVFIAIINLLLGCFIELIAIYVPFDSFIGKVGEAIVFGCVWTIIYIFIMIKPLKQTWAVINGD